ncbi:hypothetical protein H4R27_003720 [Coemansia aciculifera]|nr:hypothetical protein H4R27_003720 [Coemansia aciculifera]
MQDIIEHRLVALRDARERASLEEQAMDLRRTLLAMQKTALNAALSYERELGDAERKLDQLLPPPSLPFAAAHQLSRRGSAIRTGDYPSDGPDNNFDKPGEGAAVFGSTTTSVPACDAAVLDRSIYEGVRERGILLRSALISALEAPPLGSEASTSTSRLGRTDGWDGGASSADNMSMENIRGAKAPVAEWSEDASDFASLSDATNDDNISVSDNASLLPYDSIYSKLSPADPTRANPFSESHAASGSNRSSATPADAATLGNLNHVNSSSEDTTHMFADASDVFEPLPGSGMSASRVALPPRSRLNMVTSPTESDASFVGTPRSPCVQPPPVTKTQTITIVDTSPVDSDRGGEYLSDPEASGSEDGDLPELYQSSNGDNFRLPNLARNQSIRSRNRSRRYHLIRRTSMRKQITHSKLAGPRMGHSGSISRRQRGSLRKTRISLPIVPPEMIEYIDKRHPTAINVGSAPPIVASTEMLREMRIVPDDEYQGNIAAFASFAMKQNPAVMASNKTSPPLPPRRQSIAKATAELPLIDTATPASLALSPADSSRTKTSSASPDICPQVYAPRSAGKVASRVDVGRSPSSYSPQTMPTYVRPGNPDSPATSMLWSPVTVGGAPSLRESTDNTLLSTAHTTPQQHSPASVHQNRLGSSPDTQHPGHISTMSVMSSGARSGDMLSNAKPDTSELCASPALSSGAYSPRTCSPRASSCGDGLIQEQCTSPTRLRREISKALVQPPPDQSIYGDYPGFRRPYSDIPDLSTMTSPKFAATSPRPHSDVVSNAAAMDLERPQRFLSPTEHANASLFSMLDAHVDASNGNYSVSDIERDDSQDSSLANMAADGSKLDRVKGEALDKPSRIRRRAQTTNVSSDSSNRRTSDRVASRLSTSNGVDKAGGGASRLSKILGGFGLGGSKNKPPPQSSFILHGYYRADSNLAQYGGMASTADVGRDRSNSDSSGARVAQEYFYSASSVLQRSALPAADATVAAMSLYAVLRNKKPLSKWFGNTADIYFLDDPLSALDAIVKRHILDNIILSTGLLGDKLRFVTTNADNILPLCNQIATVDDGCVSVKVQTPQVHTAFEFKPVTMTKKKDVDDTGKDLQTTVSSDDKHIINASGESTDLIISASDSSKLPKQWSHWSNAFYAIRICGFPVVATLMPTGMFDRFEELDEEEKEGHEHNKSLVSNGAQMIRLFGVEPYFTNNFIKSAESTTRLDMIKSTYTEINEFRNLAERDPEAPYVIDSCRPSAQWPHNGKIEFRDFSMKYSSDLGYALKNVNLTINPGEKIGIVGRTGAGKSSLAKVLFRLVHENTSGSILIDGQDISEFGVGDYRPQLGMIPQESTMLNGLDKSVQKCFGSFSSGQQQLFGLCRVIMRKRKIVVLDEATANVDLETDKSVQELIRKEFSDCTVLTIAHRLETIMNSDRIIVMDKGTIAEIGTPQELLAKDGMFAQLVKTSDFGQ